MKKFIYIIALLLALPAFNSCEKHDLGLYTGEDAIFFDQQWGGGGVTDTTQIRRQNYSVVPFGKMLSTDSLLRVKIETMGHVYDYDRPFSVEIVPDSTTATEGVEFEILNPQLSILAGQNSTRLNIMIHKTERLNNDTLQIQVRLIPGEHFVIPFDSQGIGTMPLRGNGGTLQTKYGTNSDPAIHNIFVNNSYEEPVKWYEKNLGVWSARKMEILLELVEPLGWNVTTFDSNRMWEGSGYITCVNLLSNYLLEQYNKGKEYWEIDPDGTMMWANSSVLPWSENSKPEEMSDVKQ